MNYSQLNPPFQPRDGGTLQVVLVCRISTEHQDARSLNDQEQMLRDWLSRRYNGTINVIVIASRGSGELLDRAESIQLRELVAERTIDLVLTEDLGRIYRRHAAIEFCELCEDAGTRVITINDSLDTAEENWRMVGMFASMRHEQYNQDTAKRIRRSLRNRFQQGQVLQSLIYGYDKPPGAKSDDQIMRDPEAITVYDEWFRRLKDGATFSEIADWLNDCGVPVGSSSRTNRWTCAMVGRITRNPILKGVRERNRKVSKRVNKTGRHRCVPALPEELLQRDCPHLAMIEPERYDRVVAAVNRRNAKYRRKLVDGRDPRANVPKKRTRWPGQHLHCGNCGGLMVYGAHGQRDRLICTNAREYHDCWMSCSVDGPKARTKLVAAISEVLRSLPGFDDAFMMSVTRQLGEADESRQKASLAADAQIATLERNLGNITAAIAKVGHSEALLSELRRLEADLAEQRLIRENAGRQRTLPALPSRDELLAAWSTTLEAVLTGDEPAIRLVKQLVPRIEVFPVRLRGGGTPVLRAKVTIDLTAAMPSLVDCLATLPELQREVVVDLFDRPQREAHRMEAMKLRADGKSTKEIAASLGITATAVLNIFKLQRELDASGATDAYEVLNEPPADYAKLRRHRHPRFLQPPSARKQQPATIPGELLDRSL